MALTELQLPSKADFYRNIQHAATEMNRVVNRWRDLAEFIGMVEASDLDSMSVPIGQIRTDLANFRTMLAEVISLYDGASVTPTNIPADIIDKIRSM